jgi:hypothetical protein
MDRAGKLGNWMVLLVFCLYVASQTEIAKTFSTITTGLISAGMFLATAFFLVSPSSELPKLLRGWRWLGILVSVLLLYAPNVELESTITVLTKFGFLLTCTALFFAKDPLRTFDKSALATVGIVVFFALLALLGLIPSSVFSAEGVGKKYTAGFNNPNTPMYFIYCSFAYFFLRGRGTQLVVCLAAGTFLALIGAFSKTYAAGILLLAVLYFFPKYDAKGVVFRALCATLAFLAMALGVLFYTLVIWAPEAVSWLAYSPLDWASSLRLSAAIEYLITHGNTLSGYKFRGQDSMYFETYIMLGPIFMLLFTSGVALAFARANISPSAFRLAKLLTVTCVTGLTQALILNITPLSVTVFALAFMSVAMHYRMFTVTPAISTQSA